MLRLVHGIIRGVEALGFWMAWRWIGPVGKLLHLKFEMRDFFGLLLECDLERLDFVDSGFVIESDCLDLLFETSILLF
jgi:hypothetical protein